MKKRYFMIPLLLLVAALLTLGLTASADTAPEAYWGVSAEALTESGSVEDALHAAMHDSSVKHVRLASDIDRYIFIDGGEFTFDLAGHTLSSQGYTFDARGAATRVTVTDTVGGGVIASTDAGCTPLFISDGATVTVEDGKIEGINYSVRLWDNDATLTVNGGTYKGAVDTLGHVTVNGGIFDSYFLMLDESTVLTLNDLELTEDVEDTVVYYAGKLIVNTEKSIQIKLKEVLEKSVLEECFILPEGLSLIDKKGNLIIQSAYDMIARIGKDTVKPALNSHKVNRTGDGEAEFSLSPSEDGAYYYARVPSGAAAPTVDTSGAGHAYSGSFTLSITGLTAGVSEDVYFVFRDAAGNCSDAFKVTIPAHITYPLSVAGIGVNAANAHDILGDLDGARASARYDHATQTLTLDGFVYSCTESKLNPTVYGYGVISAEIAINIRLIGENEIGFYGNYLDESGFHAPIDAIHLGFTEGSASILGNGSLSLKGKGDGIYIFSHGDASLTIGEDAKISASISSEGIFIDAAGDITLTVKDNAHITVNNAEESIYLTTKDGDTTILFKDHAYYYSTTSDEEGIYANTDNSSLTVSGNANVTADGDEEGIQIGSVVLEGGLLAAYGTGSYEGILCDELTVSGGLLVAEGGDECYGIDAGSIVITGGTVIVRSMSEDHSALSAAPDLSGYVGNGAARASVLADGTGLTPYASANNGNYRYFILAPEGTRIIRRVYGKARQAPLLTADESYVIPVYDGPIPRYSVFDGWMVNGVPHQAGDTLSLSLDTTLYADLKAVPQADPIIDLAKTPSVDVYTAEGKTYFYDYELDAEIPYTGTLTFTGSALSGFIDVFAGSYSIVFDNAHIMGSTTSPILTLDSDTTVTLTLKGANSLLNELGVSAISVSEGASLTLSFTAGASLKLAVGVVDDAPLSADGLSVITLAEPTDSSQANARLTLAHSDSAHLTYVSDTSEGHLDSPTDAEIDALCAEKTITLSAHAFSRIESERAKKSDATCTEGATYYLSCAQCFRLSEETFVSETLKPHVYVDGACTACGAKESDRSGLLWLWILLPTVLLAGGGTALYFFVFKKRFT